MSWPVPAAASKQDVNWAASRSAGLITGDGVGDGVGLLYLTLLGRLGRVKRIRWNVPGPRAAVYSFISTITVPPGLDRRDSGS